MSFALKKQIKKELLSSDWCGKVEEAAVAALATLIDERHGGQLDVLPDILKACTSDLSADGKITAASVKAAATPNGQSQQVEIFELVDAFNTPRLILDPVQRKLLVDTQPKNIHATAEFKHQLYLQRLHLVHQRLQRNRMFQQNNMLLPNSGVGRGPSVQLTDLQSLKGVFGATRYVLGCISRSEDGRYVLEDASGSVPLDLAAAETAAGFYTENCVVIAEGALGHDGAFHVRALGLPPCEPRAALPLAAQRLNLWGGAGGALSADSCEAGALLALEEAERGPRDRVVVLANVWLDRPEVLDSLHVLLAGFSGVLTVPAVFVFMGNYHSRAGAGGGGYGRGGRSGGGGGGGSGGDAMLGGCDVDYGVMRELFGQLAAVIDQYPRLKAESRFVFMPGPDDPGPGPVLPQPPLPACLTAALRAALPSAVFASNPCRLRYCTQRIVLFRHDLLRRLRRRAILPLAGMAGDGGGASQAPSTQGGSGAASASQLWGHLSLTLLQQGHLAPLPLLAQPVFWQHDGALGLYPLPDAVLLADASAAQGEFMHEGCRVINPGCLPGGFFAAYLPCSQQAEMSELPRPGEEEEEENQEEEGQGQEGEGEGMDGEAGEGVVGGRGEHAAVAVGRPQQRPQQQQQGGARGVGRGKDAKPKDKPKAARKPRAAGGQGGRKKAQQAVAEEVQEVAQAEVVEVEVEGGDVEMEEAGGGEGQAAAVKGAGGRKKAAGTGAAGAKGAGRGKGKAAAAAGAAAAGPKQGTLAKAWANHPEAVAARVAAARAREELLLQDDVGADGEEADGVVEVEVLGGGGEGDVEMEEGGRRKVQGKKRRAVVEEEEEEEEEEVGEEEREGEEGQGEGRQRRRGWLAEDDDEAVDDDE